MCSRLAVRSNNAQINFVRSMRMLIVFVVGTPGTWIALDDGLALPVASNCLRLASS